MRTSVAASAVVFLVAAGCTQSGTPNAAQSSTQSATPRVDIEKERVGLMNTNRELSATLADPTVADNPDKFFSFYAPDATVYAPGMPAIKGAASIRSTMMFAHAKGTRLQLNTENTQLAASGDIGYTTGTWRLTGADGAVETGKFVTIWKNQGGGTWRIIEDIVNSDKLPGPQ